MRSGDGAPRYTCVVNASSSATSSFATSSAVRVVPLVGDAALRERWATACRAAALPCVELAELRDADARAAMVLVCDAHAADVEAVPRLAELAAVRLFCGDRPFAPPDAAGVPVDWDAVVAPDADDRELRTALTLAAHLATARFRLNEADQARRRWARLAECDPLTGLGNRRVWDQAATLRTNDRGAPETDVVCALFDLDFLKRTNDERGHAAGDDVLRAAAAGLRRAIRADDVAVRLGGDEFGLLLFGAALGRAEQVVERVRREMSAEIRRYGDADASVSCGFATVEAGRTLDFARLERAADEALRAAKQAGRDRTTAGVYSPAAS